MVKKNSTESETASMAAEPVKPPVTVGEVNELASLLTDSIVKRELQPEQAKRMGALRARAEGLKIENHKCPKCNQFYVTVEGTTLLDCRNPNCRKR